MLSAGRFRSTSWPACPGRERCFNYTKNKNTYIIYIYIYEVICVFYIGKNNVVGDFLCIYKHTPMLTHGYM